MESYSNPKLFGVARKLRRCVVDGEMRLRAILEPLSVELVTGCIILELPDKGRRKKLGELNGRDDRERSEGE